MTTKKARVFDHGTYLETYFDRFEDLQRYMSSKGFEVGYPEYISPWKEFFVRETKSGYVLSVQAVSWSEVKRFLEFWGSMRTTGDMNDLSE